MVATSTILLLQRTRHSPWRGSCAKYEGVGAVHMPLWMQTSTTRWLHGCHWCKIRCRGSYDFKVPRGQISIRAQNISLNRTYWEENGIKYHMIKDCSKTSKIFEIARQRWCLNRQRQYLNIRRSQVRIPCPVGMLAINVGFLYSVFLWSIL